MTENKYGKPARSFELWNIGNYETVYWQERQDEYLAFMLKLYQAEPTTGFRYLHGRKGNKAVHVGPLNAPVTMEELEKVVIECRSNDFNKADVLGWEWAYDVNELAKNLAKKNGVDLTLVQIPSVNEIKSALVGFDLQLLKVPDEVVENALLKHVKFAQLAYLEIETKIKANNITLKITDFQLPPTAELAEIASKVKDSRELIDYWAVDWDYKGDTFHNQWQSFRVKKFLDKAEDVKAFAKIVYKIPFFVEYRDSEGNLRNYHPDFIVVNDKDEHIIIETKGLIDVDVVHKDKRITVWCEDATNLTKGKWSFLRVNQEDFEKYRFTNLIELIDTFKEQK